MGKSWIGGTDWLLEYMGKVEERISRGRLTGRVFKNLGLNVIPCSI